MRLQMATKETLKNMWHNNLNRLMCVQLNINSIRNKFDSLFGTVF